MSDDLISIIIPCFNSARYIEETVDSIKQSLDIRTEIIIIDDGSTDKSVEVIEMMAKENDSIILLQQQNKGPYPARNYGLSVAKGNYIAFLDADDYWDKSFLNKMYSALKKGNAELAYCGWQNFGEGAPGVEPYIPPDYRGKDLPALFLKGCPWPIHAALVKRELLKKIGDFSERYFTSMDYDLWLRLSVEIKSIVLVPEVLAYYRWHGTTQISSIKSRQVLNALRIKEDFLSTHHEIANRLDKRQLSQLLYYPIKNAAFTSFWKNDLESSWELFRCLLSAGYWEAGELKYILFALFPKKFFVFLMKIIRKSG